ncbi:MAG: class II aldolase/adducin family protein [Methanosphaera stadtmanae]|nr:class II aldolase/adducin family protein [Methanosphaera stadtmanae]
MIKNGDKMDNDIIEKIIKTAHHIYDKEMILGKAGNISILDESKNFMYITASGTDFKTLKYEDILKVNINDLSYVSSSDKIPSMETNLHIYVYQKRPDVNSVVHVHSPYATAFAFSDKKLRQLEGFGEITGEYIAEVDYYPPGSKKLAKYASDALKNEDKVLLKDHGLITIGKNIDEATLLCEYVEGIAKTQYITHVLNL